MKIKHTRHKFLKIKKPDISKISSIEDLYTFQIEAECNCGKNTMRPLSDIEIQDYINDNSCSYCREFKQNHSTERDCFNYLRIKVSDLEKVIKEIDDKFYNFSKKIKNIFNYNE